MLEIAERSMPGSIWTTTESTTAALTGGRAPSLNGAGSDVQVAEAPEAEAGAALAASEAIPRRADQTFLTFDIDKEDKQVLVKVVDARSKRVLRQIPPEQLLQVQRRLTAYLGSVRHARA